MVGICTSCGVMFETTTEDAGDPLCECTHCYKKRKDRETFERLQREDELRRRYNEILSGRNPRGDLKLANDMLSDVIGKIGQ